MSERHLDQYGQLPQEIRDDPYPWYDRLRAEAPVQQVTLPHGEEAWLITRYSDAREALNDPRLSNDPANGKAPAPVGFRHMGNSDPPDHLRLRRLVAKVFTPRYIATLRPVIERTAAELLDSIADHSAVDLISEYAHPLPLTVICEMLGVPSSDHDALRGWFATMAAIGAAPADELEAAFGSLMAYFSQLIVAKRAEPGDDLLSELTAVRDGSDALDDTELLSMAFALVGAGHETVTNLIGNTVVTLLRSPAQLREVLDDPTLIPSAVEEVLRFESPVPSAGARYTTEPVMIGGVEIPANEHVMIGLGISNRDPERFDAPADFDLHRGDIAHLAFGHGRHFCIGAHLARLEAEIAVATLLARHPGTAFADPDAPVEWLDGVARRGVRSLFLSLR
ncbi:cytochrome P450 family protein [Saccharomonospora xinjiangensis]|uniref:Cytochrome P450 n=1 Tax=Saccharomonospora xinjiangensis XJ-54 TaxID=882086 RepID=I0UWV6_9PSEU|nr:cytochrome P450 [Saccharomonospora xinjiangensis]EID52359.1 cytochrome P450 [Saccharomonospora xinjiangensis XJ-54]